MTQKLESLHLEVICDAVSYLSENARPSASCAAPNPGVSSAGPAGMDQRQVWGGGCGSDSEAQREAGEFQQEVC